MAVRVTLPWPTNVNTNKRYTKTRFGVRLSGETVAWRNTVIVLVRQAGGTVPRHVPLVFRLDAYPPDGRRRDVDGLLKECLDSMALALGIDDADIAELHAYKRARDGEARLEVWLDVQDPATATVAGSLGSAATG